MHRTARTAPPCTFPALPRGIRLVPVDTASLFDLVTDISRVSAGRAPLGGGIRIANEFDDDGPALHDLTTDGVIDPTKLYRCRRCGLEFDSSVDAADVPCGGR